MRALLVLLCLLMTASATIPFDPNHLPPEAVAALKIGTKFILFSLDPEIERSFQHPEPKPEEGHHGFKVLGSLELADPASRASAIAAITDAVRAYDGAAAACFVPRHSLRVVAPNGATYDFVACFRCAGIRVYKGETGIGSAGLTGSQKRLDDLLVKGKVPLAPR